MAWTQYVAASHITRGFNHGVLHNTIALQVIVRRLWQAGSRIVRPADRPSVYHRI